MTSFSDNIKTGAAQYNRAFPTSTPAFIVGYAEDEIFGTPLAPVYSYLLGTASTSLASGIAFSASGFGTLTGSAVTISITGSLVAGGVATLDVPRCVAVFATLTATNGTFTIIGTDFYGAVQKCTFTGASGGAAFSTTGAAITPVAFKTITSASYTATTATGLSTGIVSIGTVDCYGLPYRIGSQNRIESMTMNGFPIFSTAQGTALIHLGGFVQAGLATTTAAATASTVDVRGVVALPTAFWANGTNTYAINITGPQYNVPKSNDTKEITYGIAPFSG